MVGFGESDKIIKIGGKWKNGYSCNISFFIQI